MLRTNALEIQLRADAVRQPFDAAALRESPTVVSKALELIEAAGGDPELLESLAPDELATTFATAEERRAYLGTLLPSLSDELLQRGLAGEDA
jgi:hypothetical protein